MWMFGVEVMDSGGEAGHTASNGEDIDICREVGHDQCVGGVERVAKLCKSRFGL